MILSGSTVNLLGSISARFWLVLQQTLEALRRHGDTAWNRLTARARAGSRTARRLERARAAGLSAEETLAAALHVSEYNGAAGFDLIGLELEAEEPVLVCYECKALPRGARATVHLSRNEVNVLRRHVADPELGRWKLIGIQADGTAEDLTSHLQPLLGQGDGPLHDLAVLGLEPEGVMLTLRRGPGGADGAG